MCQVPSQRQRKIRLTCRTCYTPLQIQALIAVQSKYKPLQRRHISSCVLSNATVYFQLSHARVKGRLTHCGTKGLFINFCFLPNSFLLFIEMCVPCHIHHTGKKIGNIEFVIQHFLLFLSLSLSSYVLITSTASPLRPHHHLNICS